MFVNQMQPKVHVSNLKIVVKNENVRKCCKNQEYSTCGTVCPPTSILYFFCVSDYSSRKFFGKSPLIACFLFSDYV
jgi:hypothetical protein